MCLDLLESVRGSYEAFKERGPRGGQGDRGGYGDDGGQRNRGYHDRGDRNGSGSYGGQGGNSQYGGSYGQQQVQTPGGYGYGAGSAQSPTAPQAPVDPAQQQREAEAWIAYWAAVPEEDPYKEWGGYANVVQMYAAQGVQMPMPGQQQGGQFQAGYAQSPTQQNGMQQAPPPPPPDNQAPPPPPPPGGNSGGYNSVSPCLFIQWGEKLVLIIEYRYHHHRGCEEKEMMR